jgi:hydroxypyruvate reductase
MTDPKQIARRIFHEALASIDIALAMERQISRVGNHICVDDWSCDLANISDVKVVALGKAAHAMLSGFVQLSPGLPFSGVAAVPTPPPSPIPGITYFLAGHPLPNEQSVRAAKTALELLWSATQNSLVVFLVSGGGSALMESPLDPQQALDDTRHLYQLLVSCGASIDEINTIRKHASAVKGGRLAVAAASAAKLTLAISDVPLGKESALASGPTIPDPTTIADVRRIIGTFHLAEKFPPRVRDWFAAPNLPETPKRNHPAFADSCFVLLLTSHDLFHIAHHAAESHGFLTCCDNTTDDWPLDRAVDYLLAQLEELRRANPGQRVALISDGEISSPVTGQGIGGRNSAFVLACVERIAGKPITVLSAGTDGIDGNSPAAGAVADGTTLSRAHALKLNPHDFFSRSDAFSFFTHLGDTLLTGPTGNNLRDLRIFLVNP